ncbi:MAG: methyltransferase [Sphingobacteriaceae bacterium]|nr:methyltransferase [Sphingobacteriaceae bacterium]
MNSVFKFKQFEVNQKGCAMKINTDGVLLGTLATHKNPNLILDIGTGTGVIALMLAQRFPKSTIKAVEIDKIAAETAAYNFQNSIFNPQLQCICASITDFNSDDKFDLIVSNPPFFVNDFKSTLESKKIARHTTDDFFITLIHKVADLLSENGLFWFVLPVKQSDFLVEKAKELDFFVHKQISLCSDIHKNEFRRIICLGKTNLPIQIENLYIYESQNIYTKEYTELLKPFFLAY